MLETYVDEGCVIDGMLDFTKIDPLLYTMNGPGHASYRKLGAAVGTAYNEGKDLIKPT